MTFIFIPKGKADYCIVDEENKLIHQYHKGDAYNKLFMKGVDYSMLSHIEITRENTSIPGIGRTNEIIIDYKKWFDENINNIPIHKDDLILYKENTIIPF